jgi:AcrR family transcriptional regulator
MTHTDTRQRLLEVAADRFYQGGFQAVGIDEILDVVGINKTAFYKHFESKDHLIVGVLDHRDQREMDEWMDFIRIRGRGNARIQLDALFEMLDEWFSKPDFRGCLFLNALTEFPTETDPIKQAARRHGMHLAASIEKLCEAAGATDPRGLTGQIMLLVTGAIAARHRAGERDAARLAGKMASVLIDAACAPPKRPQPTRASR